MQAGIVQHPTQIVLPVDASVVTPFVMGQLIGITGSGTAVLSDAAGATLIGIASADQDTDENTVDITVKMLSGGGAAGGNTGLIGVTHHVKVTTGSVAAYNNLWIDGANGGVTPTKPGTNPCWVGLALESGGVGECIKAAV
jgi:hypothetical protein